MGIYLGNQTACHLADEFAPFRFALAQNFPAFEWFDDQLTGADGCSRGWTFAHCATAQRVFLRWLSDQEKIRFSVHANWAADPRSPAGENKLRAALQFAEQIGAPIVVAHLCADDQGIPAFTGALVKIANDFPHSQIAVENTPENSPAQVNALFVELAKHAGGEKIGMTFDFGHANCCAATRNDFLRFLNEIPTARIIHLHAHENWGDKDAHLPLFTGYAAKDDRGIKSLVKHLVQRNFSGNIILEQYPEQTNLLTNAAHRLREMFRHHRADVIETVNGEAVFNDFIAGKVPEIVLPIAEKKIAGLPSPEIAAYQINETKPAVPVSELAVEKKPEIENFAPLPPLGTEKINPEITDDLMARVAQAMREHTSWRTRLQWIRDELVNEKITVERLAIIAVLLRYLATGALVCAEDGGHYRPNHHAATGLEIENALAKSGAPVWLQRRIYPYLPSHAAAFAAREPLTRIRDIAHRNDIPKEMKLRIKHDLQNKLHRSAGPEDLVTARAILADITAPGASYAESFVSEFKIFFGELSDFFNVPDLGNRLRAVAQKVPALADRCVPFYNETRSLAAQIIAAVELRAQLVDALSAVAPVEQQLLRMADFDLENLVFVRLSESLNSAPNIGSAEWFNLIAAAIRNAALSENDEPELAIIAAEISAWSKNYNAAEPVILARLLATLSRLLRACGDEQAKLYELFLPAAQKVGRALNIDDAAIAAFGEGVMRVGVLFQPAKMAETAMRILREQLRLPAWEIIVPGIAGGKMQAAAQLSELAEATGDLIAYLPRAEGDEEIPRHIRGIILAEPLPHLSHLAIRARQQGVLLVAAEDKSAFANWGKFSGQEIVLIANEAGVNIGSGDARSLNAGNLPQVSLTPPLPIVKINKIQLMSGEQITRENGGAKAANCAALWRLAQQKKLGGSITAPLAFCVPFGAMEIYLANSRQATRYEQLVRSLPMLSEEKINAQLPGLREIITGLPDLPPDFFIPFTENFPPETRFAARSSSNGEDLKNLAGAGLYDSIIGVPAAELATVVKQVWASLWTRRAALSRHYQGIAHTEISMAVLLQPALSPDYSFVIHTADPVSGEYGKARIEIAVGLGETLASANQPGHPYHLTVSGDGVRLWSCADYSFGLLVDQNGVRKERVNYAQIPLSAQEKSLFELAEKLGVAGREIEKQFGVPQDIEGAVVGTDIFIVQSRPQILKPKN